MNRTEIRVTGFGGQGVVLCGFVIGRAHAINAGRHATMIQSFGPEARGSACSATVVLSDTEILYPYVHGVDILVAMSSDGYVKYADELNEDGILVHERDLVRPALRGSQRAYGVPSTRIAEELGRSLVQNIVMAGFFAAAVGKPSRDHMREAVRESVPSGTEELNLKAFDAGWKHFEDTYAGGKPGTEAAAASSAASGARPAGGA